MLTATCLRRAGLFHNWHAQSRVSSCRQYASRVKSDSRLPTQSTTLPKPRLNYRDISERIQYHEQNARNRRAHTRIEALSSIPQLYTQQKDISSELNAKRNLRSTIGENIRKAASNKDNDVKARYMSEATQVKGKIAALEEQLFRIEETLFGLALTIPNDTHPSTPIGPESNAKLHSSYGPEPIAPNTARDHVTVGRALGLLDLEAGALTTGSSWYYLTGNGALLELALTNYAMSVAIKHGFSPVMTPDVVRADIAYRCGFQPRDETVVSQMYHISPPAGTTLSANSELVLAGTAEIPLGGYFANKILPQSSLPTKLVGLGRSFRAEAGARGADTHGLYRVHQFTKVELFAVASPYDDASDALMQDLLQVQKEIFSGLRIPFKVLEMPTEELGASAYRKFDMEAWMPGRGKWGEISSTSNCTDYQARRLHIRCQPIEKKDDAATEPSPSSGLPFAHTLNGTAAAIPRLIVALIENGARFEDDVPVGLDLPAVLKPFWVGDSSNSSIRWV